MNDLEKIEFEIEKMKQVIRQCQRIEKIMEIDQSERINQALDKISELLKKKEKIKK